MTRKSLRAIRNAIVLQAMVVMCVLQPAQAATQRRVARPVCENVTWTYEVTSLQSARKSIKSNAHPDVKSHVDCGLAVVQSLELAEIAPDCAECRQEYVQLMRDVVFYVRLAAENAASSSNRDAYYEHEIETRLKLGAYLLSSKDNALIKRYWVANFEGLGDAMERVRQGARFHEVATLAGSQVLSQKVFGTWTKAIRSCAAWDFTHGENKDMPGLRKALCVEPCKRAVERIRRRAQAGMVENKESMLELLDDLLPDVRQCPTGGEG